MAKSTVGKKGTSRSASADADKEKARGGDRLIADNRRARFEYDILESMEAGIVLTGTEIKSIRTGRVSLQQAFARVDAGEAWLYGLHIAPYAQGNIYNHEPTRPRKLLLHRDQIMSLQQTMKSGGLTIVPLRLYITRHRAKVLIGLAQGRKLHDKRRVIAQRDVDREMARAMRVRA